MTNQLRLWLSLLTLLACGGAFAKPMDNDVDPANLGRGDWVYFLSNATNKMGGFVPSVTDVPSLMAYEKAGGMNFMIVKAGEGATPFPSAGSPQFTASLVAAAHAVGLQIFAYNRSYGEDVPGEIAIATNALAMGADGFVIDAEQEWESSKVASGSTVGTNGPALATQLCSGIKAVFPNRFLGHAPQAIVSVHTTFPYKEFGFYCDAVMPQDYWVDFAKTPTATIQWMDQNWSSFQSGLTGKWTNSIKPLAPVGQADDSGQQSSEFTEFINYLKTDPGCVTKTGYRGVSYFRAGLHTAAIWTGMTNANIGTAPTIASQPTSLTVTNVHSTNVTFSVWALGGLPLNYQWRLNGGSIVGATNYSYIITNVQFTNAGTYSVVVSNSLGTVTSANATLTVRSAPSITQQPLNQSVVVSNNATFTVTANGTAPLTYQWQFNGTNISGANASSFTRTSVTFAQAGNYSVVVSNQFGAVTSGSANLTVASSVVPPVITTQPLSQTNIAGSNASLSVIVTGTAPLSYQWKFNNNNIANATNSVLNFTNIQAASAGNYAVVVTNPGGSDTSVTASMGVNYTLTITLNGAGTLTKTPDLSSYPPNTSITLTPGSSFTSWSGALTGTGHPKSFTITSNAAVTANFSGTEVIVDDAAASIVGSWSTGTSAGYYGSGYHFKSGGTGSAYLQFTPTLTTAGRYQVYVWYVQGSNRTAGAPYTINYNGSSLTVPINQQANGGQWDAISSGGLNFAAGTSGNVTLSDNFSDSVQVVMADAVRFVYEPPPVITVQPQSQNVVAGSNVTFTVTAVKATNAPALNYQWTFNGANISTATKSTYTRNTVQTSQAGNYAVVVSSAAGSVTSSNAVLAVNTLPSISIAPQSQIANAGETATFTVSATGTAPLSYQWTFNGANISGANGSSYSPSGVQSEDAGSYAVIVKNTYGGVLSSSATLTVNFPPSITAQPTSQTVKTGTNVLFSVNATGTAPLQYQWRFNGVAIDSADEATYALIDVETNDAGNYDVVIANSAGSVTSSVVTLVVQLPEPPQVQSLDLLADKRAHLLFTGEPGKSYWIESSDDLVNWTQLTNLLNTNGVIDFIDDDSTNAASRYYRSEQEP